MSEASHLSSSIELVCKMQSLYYFYLCLNLNVLCICVCVPHAGFGTTGGQKNALDPLELGFQTDMSSLVGSKGRGGNKEELLFQVNLPKKQDHFQDLLSSLKKTQPPLLLIVHIKGIFGLPQYTEVIGE